MNVESILLESSVCKEPIGKALTACAIWQGMMIQGHYSVCHSWICVVQIMLYYQSFLTVHERGTGGSGIFLC